MPRVSAFSIAWLDLWFNSSDHLPPHFHARRPGEWEIRVFFLLSSEGRLEYSVKWRDKRRGPRRSDLDLLSRLIVEQREALVKEWNEKVRAAPDSGD